MQNYTSILWVHTNEPIGEKIAVGLLFGNQQSCLFHMSERKLKALSHLISEDAITSICETLGECIEYRKDDKGGFWVISQSWKHPHGLYFFGEPSPMNLELTKENMLLLFDAMIGKD